MNTTPILALIALAAIQGTAIAADVIKDNTYNMPDDVARTMGVDAVMRKMETAVKPEVLAEFQKKHPASFWLFGEDRQFAVRNNIIPAHWFEGGAPQYGKFSGTARPGEYYVFQVGVLANPQAALWDQDLKLTCNLPKAQVKLINNLHLDRWATRFEPGSITPLWIGIQIPPDAKAGDYKGTFQLKAGTRNLRAPNNPAYTAKDPLEQSQTLAFTLKVAGAPLKESGTADAWRLARLKWLDSKIGDSDTEVTRPFTPIQVQARSLSILGRRISLGANGIPAQFTSYFSASNTSLLPQGRDAFAAAPDLQVVIDGKIVEFTPGKFKFTRQSPVAVEWQATSTSPAVDLLVTGRLEYDGLLDLKMRLGKENREVKVDDVRWVVPWMKDTVKYAMGLGLQGGKVPAKHDWKWDVRKNQDAIWLGDVNLGSMLRFKGANHHRPLINAYYAFQPLALPESWGGGAIHFENTDGSVTLTANSGPLKIDPGMMGARGNQPSFDLDWYFTPFKPLDVKQHFTDRYYHAQQGKPVEDTAALRKDGANILEIHHNRLCNPYINYPYNDDSFANLTDFIKKAHTDDMRVAMYYTTRELTQNLPEFFALKSLHGEVILPRRDGVAWPVTNPGGPHPWLKQHVGSDIVPAWRENLKFPAYKSSLDLAVITTPDSRWNNFYLEGLDYLVKKAGIDGLYIDDTALDRKSMQRARRILDADGNTGRRISMHSWNHFNGLAAWNNSSIAFMELYPYYDGLWHGESFNCNASPEFMLIEMSGIPYGLMSEMLDAPNPWHGMVFGMRTRWPWSGDPRNVWKLEDVFGIADSRFIGWWDPANPVKTDHPETRASVYQKNGKTLIALASWSPTPTPVKLTINWNALGLSPQKTTLWAPACQNFQQERVFAPDAAIPVEPNKGWLLIADESPRQVSPQDTSANP